MAPATLRFHVLPSHSRRAGAPLVPCVSARVNGVDVVRLLDPEHREPLVSLARLASAAGVAPSQALAKYLPPSPSSPPYSLLLAGLAPFPDLWVSLGAATDAARDLGLFDSLCQLLNPNTKGAWSCVEWAEGTGKGGNSDGNEARRGELVSNWTIPTSMLPVAQYSYDSLQRTPFPELVLLPSPTLMRLPMTDSPEIKSSLLQPNSFNLSLAKLTSLAVCFHDYEEGEDENDRLRSSGLSQESFWSDIVTAVCPAAGEDVSSTRIGHPVELKRDVIKAAEVLLLQSLSASKQSGNLDSQVTAPKTKQVKLESVDQNNEQLGDMFKLISTLQSSVDAISKQLARQTSTMPDHSVTTPTLEPSKAIISERKLDTLKEVKRSSLTPLLPQFPKELEPWERNTLVVILSAVVAVFSTWGYLIYENVISA